MYTQEVYNLIRARINALQIVLDGGHDEEAYKEYCALCKVLYVWEWVPSEEKECLFLREEWMPFAK